MVRGSIAATFELKKATSGWGGYTAQRMACVELDIVCQFAEGVLVVEMNVRCPSS
jgi:hypothetical protein